ncbi:MAG: hypothetical protein M1820_008619 [Bogoriella megaspora]|nr:MAG: hypothetical protein M1820_008619 [Bogoriella megaspora]
MSKEKKVLNENISATRASASSRGIQPSSPKIPAATKVGEVYRSAEQVTEARQNNINLATETTKAKPTISPADNIQSAPLSTTEQVHIPSHPDAAKTQKLLASPREDNLPPRSDAQSIAALDPHRSGDGIKLPSRPRRSFGTHKAPIWSQALKTLKESSPELCADVEKMENEVDESSIERWNAWFEPSIPNKLQPKKESSAAVQRIKRYLPSLAAVKGVVMTAAALDPHKVAPIVCASIFFAVEFSLNSMTPEDRDKSLDVLFESINAINEWISFESNFPQKSHPAIKDGIREIEESLPDLYLRALNLVSSIHRTLSVDGGWKSRLAKLTNKIMDWERGAAQLKTYRTKFTARKKTLEETLAGDAYVAKVLDWIKEEDDPEPGLKDIRLKSTSGGRYERPAQWFFDRPEFQAWSNNFQTMKSQHHVDSWRTMWIHGTYGTGKTTLMYRVLTALQSLSENPSRDDTLRVIPYFCDASKVGSEPPVYKTLIRALCRRLSLMPDFTLAQVADSFYTGYQRPGVGPPSLEQWQDLLSDLIEHCSGVSGSKTHIVFLIDALDECKANTDTIKFLDQMSKITKEHSDVRFLCTSHQQVPVKDYFSFEPLYDMDIGFAQSTQDMDKFVHGEIEHRRAELFRGKLHSVFFDQEHAILLHRLRDLLLRNANGMFTWVQTWLDIVLPLFDDQNQTERPENAEVLLRHLQNYDGSDPSVSQNNSKLMDGYQRLWNLNNLKDYGSERIRLFHLVLCALEPLSLEILTGALRIQINGSVKDENAQKVVKRFCANFLTENQKGELVFVQGSARAFLSQLKAENKPNLTQSENTEFSKKRSHRCVATLYIKLMRQPSPLVWQKLGLDHSAVLNGSSLEKARKERPFRPSSYLLMAYKPPSGLPGLRRIVPKYDLRPQTSVDGPGLDNIERYLCQWGLRHCFYAADKQSLTDEVWMEVLNKMVLNPNSAFGFLGCYCNTLPPAPTSPLRVGEWVNFDDLVTQYEARDKIHLRYSHVLAWLDIITEDGSSDSGINSLSRDYTVVPRESRLQLLLKHAVEPASGSGLNALGMACWRNNPFAVDFFIKGTNHLYGGQAVIRLLDPSSGDNHLSSSRNPLEWAVRNQNLTIIKMLLEVEKQFTESNSLSHSASRQWNTKTSEYFAGSFSQDTVCDILKFAPPIDFNVPNSSSAVSLLEVAIRRDWFELVEQLLEDHDFDLVGDRTEGFRPLKLARHLNRYKIIDCLIGHGAR